MLENFSQPRPKKKTITITTVSKPEELQLDVSSWGNPLGRVVIAKLVRDQEKIQYTQQWCFLTSEEKGYYYIANRNQGNLLDVMSLGSRLAAVVVAPLYFGGGKNSMIPHPNNDTQKWKIDWVGDSADRICRFVNKAKGMVLRHAPGEICIVDDDVEKQIEMHWKLSS